MARPKRKRSTRTFEATALEADRQAALDRLIRDAPPIDERAYAAFLEEMRGPKPT